MENVSDAEFGAKSVEEAPILIAQRYLNIFRQIHIFSKETRDKFDDELLALPENVINFIKRMPGGRLLIEHIEDVKTERGISFVKSRREEFSNDAAPTAPSATPSTAVAPAVGGGSVVMDASFADTLAQSLAAAFKSLGNLPSPVSVSGGSAFDLIAEEIRTSHSSLLDVLKETRNITDSVIASQVSISRILEGILASRAPDGSSNDDLGNRVAACQATITKLLENLYTANAKNDQKLDKYLDLENRLAHFENQIRSEVNQSLYEVKSLLSNNVAEVRFDERKTNIQPTSNFSQLSEKSDNYKTFAGNNNKKNKKKKNFQSNTEEAINVSLSTATSSFADNASSLKGQNSAENTIGGVIHNSSYKHEDDFTNINLDEPPLEEVSNVLQDSDVSVPINNESNDILSDLESLDNIELPDKTVSGLDKDISDINLDTDDLNLDHLADDVANSENTLLDQHIDSDINAISTPNQENLSIKNDLSDNVEIINSDIKDDINLDNISDINLDDFNSEEINDNITSNGDVEVADLSLDSFETNDDVDDNATSNSDVAIEDNDLSLDSFETNDDVDDNATSNSDVAIEDNDLSLDDFNTDDSSQLPSDNEDNLNIDEENFVESENNTEQASRFSDTLDKIRDALTSDNIDISSLDEPIALDDYSDDENVSEDEALTHSTSSSNGASADDEWEYEYVEDDGNGMDEESTEEGDWEYEYVDENGNVVTSKGDDKKGEDWEWEYVDEDQSADSNDENKPQ